MDFYEIVVRLQEGDALTVAAAGTLAESMQSHGYAAVSADALVMWLADMAADGLKLSTRKKYFSRLHSIYREWKTTPGADPFEGAKEAVDADFNFHNEDTYSNLRKLQSLLSYPGDTDKGSVKGSDKGSDKDHHRKETINLFLYLFYNPAVTLAEALSLKFDDVNAVTPQAEEIIDNQKESRGKATVVFGLGRGRKKESQIAKEALAALADVAREAGMRIAEPFTRQSITALWIAAALKAGVTMADIRAIVAEAPAEYPALALLPAADQPDSRKRKTLRKVADAVNNKPRQWFVMKMRPGQTPDTVKNMIAMTTEGILDTMLFYYPTRKVLRQVGKGKPVKKELPYIPGVLFFKVQRNVVPMLMNRIGEVAWCYKYTNRAGSEYCTISRSEMKIFQRCIGEFTPDVEMELAVMESPMKKGTHVRINGGGRMMGMEGVIESVRNVNGTRTYTLSLTDHLQARWTVKDMEEIYIEKV